MSTTNSQTNRRSATSYDQVSQEAGTGNSTVTGKSATKRTSKVVESSEKTGESKGETKSKQVTKGLEKSTSKRERKSVRIASSDNQSERNGRNQSDSLTNGTGTESRTSQTKRELTSKSIRTGGSNQKANIGCTISFVIPILGRVPTNSNSTC